MDQVSVKPIPNQVVNELASYGPLDLKTFFEMPEGAKPLRFQGELKNGQALPKGLICTSDGVVTGIPAKDTQGNYEIVITAESDDGSTQATFFLTIKPSYASDDAAYVDKLKSQVWEALQQQLPIPALTEMMNLPLTKLDIYYLLERWGVITIWDAFNLDPPSDKKRLTLPGASQHYNVYDRGSSLIGCPKDLFSHERTTEDGLQTARAIAREVYNRNWTIEMAGLDKMVRAAWVEVQILGDQYGKSIEIINFTPTAEDIRLYTTEATMKGVLGGPV